MPEQRVKGYTVSGLMVYIVWRAKYRCSVLQRDVQKNCRKILIQISDAEGVNILKRVVGKNHFHVHLE